MAEAPYQSLYRQFRPQRFREVRGQDHVTRALINAVRHGRVGHAYLFSGPRGTGKTSTARILAKALNCVAPEDGEPCGHCESCVAVRNGSSLDVIELDAASNNGVDAMRDLVARAALGSPGRWKVYIVDEVHMLSTAASNALLKTLEEPPGHVVFVLATTDPQKVLPTIRSRAQHFDFHLLGPDVLAGLLRDVDQAAGLGIDEHALQHVVRKGNGSARDALSALDQVVAAGAVVEESDAAAEVVEALCASDSGKALLAVAAACDAGRDPRRLASEVVEHLRGAFLAVMAPEVVGRPAADLAQLADQAARLGTPALVRAMEVLGEALVVMRDAVDTRVTLEVALVRLCAPEADTTVAALLERIDRLERRISGGAVGENAPAVPSAPAPAAQPVPGSSGVPSASSSPGASGANRAALGAVRARRSSSVTAAPPDASVEDRPAPAATPVVDRDEITKAWGDSLLGQLTPGARSVFRSGRWMAVDGSTAQFAVPNAWHLDRAEGKRQEVEAVLGAHFGAPVRVVLVEDRGASAVSTADDAPAAADDVPPAALSSTRRARRDDTDPIDEAYSATEIADMAEAGPGPTMTERLLQAFPGAEEVPS